MKLVKLTMLAATAAIVASAFVGASSASALTHKIGALCDAAQLLLCEVSHLIKHPLLGRGRLVVGSGAFNAGFVTIKCESGLGETNEVQSQQEGAFNATLEKLTFSGCTGCTGLAVKTPQAMEINMESEGTESWRLKVAGAKFTASGCPFGTTCTYESNLDIKLQMDAEGAFGDPEGKEFKRGEGSGGLCAAVGKWESGRTRPQWKLDDAKGSIHTKIWPTLLEVLTKAEGTEL
jgi:predicted metal-binding protein